MNVSVVKTQQRELLTSFLFLSPLRCRRVGSILTLRTRGVLDMHGLFFTVDEAIYKHVEG